MAALPTTNAEIEAALKELDGEIRALQVRYEQYFLGMERMEPGPERAALRKALMDLKRSNPRNTGLKFRLNSLWTKFLSYERMWQRTVTEIEEGRYHRDVFKARLRGRSSTGPSQAAEKLKEAIQKEEAAAGANGSAPERATGEGSSAGGTRSSVGGNGSSATGRNSAPGGAGVRRDDDLSNAKLNQLYQAYVTAKKRCKEDTSKLSLEALERSLRKQIPQLKEKHRASSVDFKVVIKGGKAMLKAVPRGE